jgi:hypothetical protein
VLAAEQWSALPRQVQQAGAPPRSGTGAGPGGGGSRPPGG